MSTAIVIILVAAIVFGLCRLVDKAFARMFRSKAQHMSGLAVRANKRYGLFGVILSTLGVLAICAGVKGERVLFWGGHLPFVEICQKIRCLPLRPDSGAEAVSDPGRKCGH